MEKETFDRFNREMRSFYALIIINLAGAGLAMSFGIAWIVPNITPMIQEQSIQISQLALTGLVVVGCVVALRWLIASVEVFDGFDDLRDDSRVKESEANGDVLTGLIVRSMAWYRERKANINDLKFGSRVTGAFFLLSAVLQILNLASTLSSTSPFNLTLSMIGFILCLVLGVAGLLIPYSITRFVGTWDHRIEASDDASKRLERIVEGQ